MSPVVLPAKSVKRSVRIGAEAVLGRGLPFGAGPDAEAFLRFAPGEAVRDDVELFEGGTLVSQAKAESQVGADTAVDGRGDLVTVE